MRYLLPFVAACGAASPSPRLPPPRTTPVAAAIVAHAPPPHATKIRSVFGITEYRLDNGLQILLFPDPTQSTVTVNVTYLVGSRLEGYGQTGMAHLLEHMMFKGSPRHRNVLALLEAKGGEANGSTTYDRTNYYETLPASQGDLDWVLDLEADRMIHAEVSADDLKTEFSVVRNEFEGGENDPDTILGERIAETAYIWHNYGKPTIGSRSDIERVPVPVPALRAFYEQYYQPDNAVLVVSGKFDDASALASVEHTFGAIPRPTRTLSSSYTIEPVQDGERDVTLRRTGDVHVIGIAYHGVAGSSPDFPALEAAIDVLTREPSGRLYKQLIDPKLAASLGGTTALQHDPSLAMFTAQVRDAKDVAKVEQLMLAAIEHEGASRIEDREVERWRAAAHKELELAMANSQQIAIALSEFAALGDWRTLFAYRDQLDKVTAADVQRVAKLYFKSSNRTLGTFIPSKEIDRAPPTEAPDVAAYVKGVEGGDVKDQGEVFAATLDNIAARTTHTELAGGIAAALLPKKTRGGKVRLGLRFHWGDERSLQGTGATASLMGALMMRGTVKRSYQDIADLEDELKAQLSISASADGMTLEVETVRDKLPAAIDLLAELATSPSFPDKQLEIVRQQQLAALEQQLQDPGANAGAKVEQLIEPWPKSDPRHRVSIAEQIDELKQVKLADIKRFYKDFAGSGHGGLVVVGDFDAAVISAQVAKRFAGWQTKRPYARLPAKAFGIAGQSASIDLADKAQSTIVWAYDLPMRDTHPDYPGLVVALHVLGGDSGSRLWMRLREHEGLSYDVVSWASADPFDDRAVIVGQAIVAPQNIAKAKISIVDEFTKLAGGTVLEAELQHAKDSVLKDQDTQLSDDAYVVTMLGDQLYRGRTIDDTKALRAKIRAVTVADIARIAKQYLDPKRLTIVDAGDTSRGSVTP